MVAPDYHEEDGHSTASSTTQLPSQHPLRHRFQEHHGGGIDYSTVPLSGPGEVLPCLVSLLVVFPCPQSMLLALVLLLVISQELGEVGFHGRVEVLQVEAAEEVDNPLGQQQEA